jgi:catechol 2,3-dioxygenase-like lactoylglutathione lyase family enzyme
MKRSEPATEGPAMRIDHVQLAIPTDGEVVARRFWCGLLHFTEVQKPENLAKRGGAWFVNGDVTIHVGVDAAFVPAQKAHVALAMIDLDGVVTRLELGGHPVRWDDEIPGVRRCHVNDPFGNRIELISE